MSKYSAFFDFLKSNEILFVDFRFTDLTGKWHHITRGSEMVDEDILKNGIGFDGSSIHGWKPINESDMYFVPDVSTAFIDPFSAQPTVVVFCDVFDPKTDKNYDKCPRHVAQKAEEYLIQSGVGDIAYFGPEPEFFIFDKVSCNLTPFSSHHELGSSEIKFEQNGINGSDLGHRPRIKGGYFPAMPVDHHYDIRNEMYIALKQCGLTPSLHHHEVAVSQSEIGIEFGTLKRTADQTQIFKYVVRNVANTFGKTATFMPKPVYGDNGSGMHVHQSIWDGKTNLFVQKDNNQLSELALYYIGGIIKHAKAINAFSNPTTNSYKRLVPGFEAPVFLAYSEHNRSASIRIPHSKSPKAKRIEARFPDPTSNSYLVFSAMLLAGLDGIKNKIHPGEMARQNLYEVSAEESKRIPRVCVSLREALEALDKDRDFLVNTGVFTNDLIDSYLALKQEEVNKVESIPNPAEFDEYFSC